MNKFLRFVAGLFGVLVLALMALGGGGMWLLYHYGRGLPDYQQLAHYEPPTVTRVHAGDGRLLAEYAREKRVFVPVGAMPVRVIRAFLSAEDKKFFTHGGINILSIVRATVTNLANLVNRRRPVGASTITQQVAKNFLLTNEVSLERKIKEAILALRIERTFTKERILELYLNEIYLGFGSYGVAAAALNYFNKPLDELSLAEAAYLAALPKAPSNYHPLRRAKAAKARRDWVIGRMRDDGHISPEMAAWAQAQRLIIRPRSETEFVTAPFFAEEVRRNLISRYGEDGLYEGGLSVRATMSPRLQSLARRTLRAGLEAYDRRHGWRGPLATIVLDPRWAEKLTEVAPPAGLGSWSLAVILAVDDLGAELGFASGARGYMPFAGMAWARPWRQDQRWGATPKQPSDVVTVGDVVPVAAMGGEQPGIYTLEQVPDINGALVALDPHTGRVLALVGGYDFQASEFNRATQARRQPGSAFKPMVYAAALENGFTPSSLVLDAPFVVDQGPGQGKWKPANYTKKFYGPSTLRLGIEKSRNLMTVRLAQFIGMEAVVAYARRFGVVDEMPQVLSMALGAGETTLLRLTAAYAMLVNGGKRIQPSIIDRIQDRRGATVFRHDERPCEGCREAHRHGRKPPRIPDLRTQVVEPATAYQLVSMLEGVVERGTGRIVRTVKKPLAGKTGTTNDAFDTWFIGFAPDLVVGVFAGFDRPRTLGRGEQGASVAAPIFRDFMAGALAQQPAVPFRIPAGIRLVRVSAATGLPAQPGDSRVILEAFKPGSEPSRQGAVLDGSQGLVRSGPASSGTGGLY